MKRGIWPHDEFASPVGIESDCGNYMETVQQKSLRKLDDYFRNTPKEEIQAQFDKVTNGYDIVGVDEAKPETWQEALRRMRKEDLFDDKYNTRTLEFVYAFQMGFKAKEQQNEIY